MTNEHWRWNSNIPWHYFSSLCFEANLAKKSNNQFMKYHHIRSCLYYGVSSVEAFLNVNMRKELEKKGVEEKEIWRTLKSVRDLNTKVKEWPEKICGKKIPIENKFLDFFEIYKNLRNEVTHPKKRDHSVYNDLDNVDPFEVINYISFYIAAVYIGRGEAYPYWLTSWNYVGMNGNPSYPMESNNLNGFVWSLRRMGFNMPINDSMGKVFEDMYMKSLDGFKILKETLDNYPSDIEPYVKEFPFMPRLTRRWWDIEYIQENID